MDRKTKLRTLGFNHPKDLKIALNCTLSLAYKIWYGQAQISIKQAKKIKKQTGASLDFLLNGG